MPHFNETGAETWVCQKGGHICTGESHWVDRGSELSKQLGGVHGNVCHSCYTSIRPPVSEPAPKTAPAFLPRQRVVCQDQPGGPFSKTPAEGIVDSFDGKWVEVIILKIDGKEITPYSRAYLAKNVKHLVRYRVETVLDSQTLDACREANGTITTNGAVNHGERCRCVAVPAK